MSPITILARVCAIGMLAVGAYQSIVRAEHAEAAECYALSTCLLLQALDIEADNKRKER